MKIQDNEIDITPEHLLVNDTRCPVPKPKNSPNVKLTTK